MNQNYVGQTLGLTALITVGLLVLSTVSKKSEVSGFEVKKMDILHDIRVQDSTDTDEFVEELIDTSGLSAVFDAALDTANTMLAAQNDTFIPPPLSPQSVWGREIEDYSQTQDGMSRFFKAVDSIASHKKKVRVAFFGDSFVEGDILLGDFRDTLQSLWGGAGVGFVPVTSEISRFRRTFLQTFQGWRAYSILHPDEATRPLGINGYVYLPGENARMGFEGTRQYGFSNTKYWGDVRLFYQSGRHQNITWSANGDAPVTELLPVGTDDINVWEYDRGRTEISSFSIQINGASELSAYGVALESGPGFYLDNFSVRGNSGGRLLKISPKMMKAFDRMQQYDLIILQHGLNAATNSLRNIGWYRAELKKTYAHIKQCFPDKPVLIISVPDRGGKIDGEIRTLPSVPAIVQMQRELARENGFMFFDFYYFMGGYGAMAELAKAQRPRLANLDYTHLTHEGGRMLGLKLAEMFLNERRRTTNYQ